ncbi:hypothetical protein BOSE127_160273 [Bosea sp. 127]|nr:hypothetical protein BOSE127_160273 [Bosea sp. 127]
MPRASQAGRGSDRRLLVGRFSGLRFALPESDEQSTNEKSGLAAASFSPEGNPRSVGGELLLDVALQRQRARRELTGRSLDQEGVEAAAVIDGAQRIRRDAQADRTAERIRLKRDVDEVRPEDRLGLAVRVADEVAGQGGFPGQFATAGHDRVPKISEYSTQNADTRRAGRRAPEVKLKWAVYNGPMTARQGRPCANGPETSR